MEGNDMQYPYPIARFYFATLCYIANILLFYLMLDFKFDYYQIQLPYHTINLRQLHWNCTQWGKRLQKCLSDGDSVVYDNGKESKFTWMGFLYPTAVTKQHYSIVTVIQIYKFVLVQSSKTADYNQLTLAFNEVTLFQCRWGNWRSCAGLGLPTLVL